MLERDNAAAIVLTVGGVFLMIGGIFVIYKMFRQSKRNKHGREDCDL